MSMRLRVAGLAAAAAVLGACHRHGSAPAASSAAPTPAAATPEAAAVPGAADSLRGTVERVGADPKWVFVVHGAGGATCVATAADASVSLAAIDGLDVTLWGTRGAAPPASAPSGSCGFAVSRFAVRAVGGVPAVDGVLRVNNGLYALEVGPGDMRSLSALPATLKTQVGARVYWVGPLDRAPQAYGILAPAR